VVITSATSKVAQLAYAVLAISSPKGFGSPYPQDGAGSNPVLTLHLKNQN